MSKKRPTVQRATEGGPDLVVMLGFVVKRTGGDCAETYVHVSAEGDERLVQAVKAATGTKLQPAVQALRVAILDAIGAIAEGPTVDLLPLSANLRSSRIGRA